MKTAKRPGLTATAPGSGTEKDPRENIHDYTAKSEGCQLQRKAVRMETTEKPNYWAVIPAKVRYDDQLPPMARLLYAEISSLTDATGYCFASNAYFQRLFDVAERTLQRHLRVLEIRGYIRIENGNGGPGRRRIFAGINPLSGNPDKNVGVTPTKMSPNPDKNVARNKKENKKENNPPAAPQGAGGANGEIWDREAFEAFWQLYPKKKDKAKAVKEWNRLKADRKLMRVMSAALKTQMASEEWQRDNGRAIPYPCRWLSHRRWEDEQDVTLAAPAAAGEEGPEWI